MTFIFLQLFEAAVDNGSARLSDHLPYSLEVAPEHGVLYDCKANFNNSLVATSEMSSLALASPPSCKSRGTGCEPANDHHAANWLSVRRHQFQGTSS